MNVFLGFLICLFFILKVIFLLIEMEVVNLKMSLLKLIFLLIDRLFFK